LKEVEEVEKKGFGFVLR